MSAPDLVALAAQLHTRRRLRQARAMFTVERHGAVIRAVRDGWPAVGAVVCPQLVHGRALRHALGALQAPTCRVSPETFRRLCTGTRASGVILVLHQQWTPLGPAGPHDGWVVVSEVRSPGNLGTILRTADAAGLTGVIVLGDALEPWAPPVVRASMGGILGLTVTRTRRERLVRWAREQGVTLVGTSPTGRVRWSRHDWTGPTATWLGAERAGMSDDELACCDAVVQIPLASTADSLNIGVAAGVLLFERQRQLLDAGVDAAGP